MKPWVKNIEAETNKNTTFRTALWTGKHLQLTVMEIRPGEDVGLEVHPQVDQFLRIEQGKLTSGLVPLRTKWQKSTALKTTGLS